MWKNAIEKCFSEEGTIQLLLNAESITNAFGHTGQEGVLIYNSSLKIKIEYEDIEKLPYKRRYTSHQMLIVKSSKDFAGTFFQ